MAAYHPRGGRSGRFTPRQMEPEHKINDAIRAKTVRIVGDNIGESRVVSIQEARRVAEDLEMDLVQIVENANPPVCRVVDYQKFLYQQKKRQKELKAKAQKIVIKEIRFGPNTDEHDYAFKLRHAKKFLQEGAKVKALVFFKGRSIVFKDNGKVLLLNLAKDLEGYGKVASDNDLPTLEGKRLIMYLTPVNPVKKK